MTLVQEYSAFIENNVYFRPRLTVKIAGVNVSDLLIQDADTLTDALLDTPTFNVYSTSYARFYLDNSDNRFSTSSSPNFFSSLGSKYKSGRGAPVEISVRFDNEGAPGTERIFFVGYIESITELAGVRWVSVLVMDKSGLLRHRVVEDFGTHVRAVISGLDAGSVYTDGVPILNLPENSVPVSRNSFSAGIYEGEILQIFPSLPLDGRYASYKYGAVDENRGQLILGGAPPKGGEQLFSVGYKTAYRYRTPEALVYLLAEETGVFEGLDDDDAWSSTKDYSIGSLVFHGTPRKKYQSILVSTGNEPGVASNWETYWKEVVTEKTFAKSLIESPVLEHTLPQWTSHGRPYVPGVSDNETPVVRWVQSETVTDSDNKKWTTYYFAGNRHLFKYERRSADDTVLDEYSLIASCPDSNAAILQFVKHGGYFYVLTASDWEGRVGKLWKVEIGQVWENSDIIPDADPSVEHFFDYVSRSDYAVDNRKSFVVDNGYLYYVFGDSNTYGIRRVELSSGSVSTVYSETSSGSVTSAASWDFVISGADLYAFVCLRPNSGTNQLKIYKMPKMAVNGAGKTEIFSQDWSQSERWEPAMVSDVVVRGNDFYFVLTYSRDEVKVGFSELCKVTGGIGGSDLDGDDRTVLKVYENSLFSARSLVLDGTQSTSDIYFVEGTWLSSFSDSDEYPTFEDAGHLNKIDSGDVVSDLGPVWRSFRSSDGRGEHTAFVSNLLRDSDGIFHCISGYGLLSVKGDTNPVPPASRQVGEVQSPGNFVWLQYGKKLAGKIPLFPTNDKTAWQLLTELAHSVDFEIGFTPGQDEIAAYDPDDSEGLKPKGYLFFRERSALATNLVLDESSYLNLQSELDTTHVFNYISVRLSNGQVWVSKDPLVDSKDTLAHSLETGLFPNESVAWAEVIGNQILARQKDPRLKIEVPLKVFSTSCVRSKG